MDRYRGTVIIAGAGASAPLGYSTLIDFETAIARYAPHATAKERRQLADIFQGIRQSLVSQNQYTDFEAILAQFARYLEIFMTMRLDSFLADEFLKSVPDRFRYSAFWQKVSQGQEIVSRIILDHYAEKPTSQTGVKAFSEFLNTFVTVNNGILDYFTTNYDLGIEYSCKKYPLSVPLVTGLKDSIIFRGPWNSNLLETTKPNRKGLYVHRLHGCVRWFQTIEKPMSKSERPITARPRVPEKNKLLEPCVMYPGRKLNISISPYVDSFRRLRDSLQKASSCLIIGTSFRDNNIVEYLLEANDRDSGPLPMIVVDLYNVRPRFLEKVRQVRKEAYFHYARRKWKVDFIVGDYLSPDIQRCVLNKLENPKHIRTEEEQDA